MAGEKTRSVLALGGNLGDRVQTIQSAIAALARTPGIKVLGQSKLYESHAVTKAGVDQAQPKYLNGVVEIATSLKPKALLEELNRLENQFGRVRIERWAARTLDIDIITYGTELIETKALIVPHPRAHERGFVLVPWAQLDPQAKLPGLGSVQDLARSLEHEVWEFHEA
ncbi:2-amino-4-hydroxy-6-hydroxymethyldihydropteridine diphosphokinase [Aquiluna borgnonia]|uniref:2-amino-4-hydroxy-6-hydroxymethyldihydropteridine diphosphokinase n=1 Tax=Aquiluna borgnonia TaxID=2499157 RepID=A0A7D4UM96_9MICO|nr:2-amino-4-hydroxy-6-hydroxymethyldihydropteridine diphosphokinase [Aquiluna borgnonia]QKJ25798.1 2-amino-4-hydroxy-6-hydroxymethyldihydropteridine diphosphokinase [Aquiluna borgnonia]